MKFQSLDLVNLLNMNIWLDIKANRGRVGLMFEWCNVNVWFADGLTISLNSNLQ